MSQLSQVVSTALLDYVREDDGEAYARLYEKYTGIRRPPPDFHGMDPNWVRRADIHPGSSLAVVLVRNTLRIGTMANHGPYYLGGDAGFEYELGEEVARRIGHRYHQPTLAAEWVEVDVTTSGDGTETLGIFDALRAGLVEGRYDLVLAGTIDTHDPTLYLDIAWTWPTVQFYWSVVYTGRPFDHYTGEGDVADQLKDATRWTLADLVAFVSRVPGVLLVSSDDGPSQTAAESLRDAARKRGGIVYAATTPIAGLGATIEGRYAHFVVGDGIALATSARRVPTATFLGVHVWDDTFFVRGFTAR